MAFTNIQYSSFLWYTPTPLFCFLFRNGTLLASLPRRFELSKPFLTMLNIPILNSLFYFIVSTIAIKSMKWYKFIVKSKYLWLLENSVLNWNVIFAWKVLPWNWNKNQQNNILLFGWKSYFCGKLFYIFLIQ